jgi:1,2-dihydroxy-3-keto-5-methylthiopentene dioxygenase
VELGVLYWEGLTGEDDPRLQAIRAERGYTYSDLVECCPKKLPGYDTKILSFYEEHIHRDEEIRFCMDGSGYFDIRDAQDRWIRILIQKGDMIILPEGIMHRYTNDVNNYIKALRLFVGEPIWTPYNRSEIAANDDSVVKYRRNFIEKN